MCIKQITNFHMYLMSFIAIQQLILFADSLLRSYKDTQITTYSTYILGHFCRYKY